MGVRKEKAMETKKKIYQSAESLFAQHGFDNVNVDDIVARAGVAKGSFYVHYPSKNALIAELINDYVNKVDMDYKAFLDTFSPETPASHILLALVGKIAEVIIHVVGFESMRNLYSVQITKDVDTRSVMDYNRELYRLFHEVIDSGLRQGTFCSDFSADEITRHFIMAYRGLTYEWCVRYPDYDLKAQAVRHFQLLLAGIDNASASRP